jgi:hypothetical protein
MSGKIRSAFMAIILFTLLAMTTTTARADPASGFNFNGIGREVAIGITVGVVVVATVTIVTVYLIARHNHNVTGCAVSSGGGIELQSDGGGTTYLLAGNLSGIPPGERLRLTGKKAKKVAANSRTFLVEKVAKDFGPCRVQRVTP